MLIIPRLRLFFVDSMAAWLLKIRKKQHLSMYPSSTHNMLVICLFGLAKYLAFRHKSLNHNMVLNQVEAEELHRRQTPILTSSCGVNMVIGLHSKAKSVI